MVPRTHRRHSAIAIRAQRTRRQVLLILTSLTLFVLLAYLVNTDGPAVTFDWKVAFRLRAHVTPRRTHLAELIFTIGDPQVLIPLAIVASVVIALWRRSVLRGGLILVAVGIASALSGILKELLRSQRPIGWADPLHSFPSTHTTATATLFGVVAVAAFIHWKQQNLALLAAAVGALAVGASTVVYRAHWPTDVLGGLLLAAMAVATTRLILIDR